MRRRRAAAIWSFSAAVATAGVVVAQTPPAAPDAPAQPPPPSGATTVKRVTVTGRKDGYRSSPDKRSYDITGDLHAATGSVADVLRDVPSVEVSPDGKVSLRGDPHVVIYVDGKPSTLFSTPQALQTIPADQYERVEVMTSPSAAYAPDGSAGIINLVTKKTARPGDSGSVRLTQGVQGESASLLANRKGPGLTLGVYGAVGHDRRLNTFGGRSQTLDATGDPISTLTTAMRSPYQTDWGFARTSLEWDPDPKTQVTGEISANASRTRSGAVSRFDAEDNGASQVLARDGASRFTNADVQGGLTLRRNFAGDGHALTLTLTQDHATRDSVETDALLSLNPPSPPSYERLVESGGETHTDLKGDYTRPMPSKAALEAGFDIRTDAVDNGHSGFLSAPSPIAPNDPGQTDRFRFKRRISALYVTYDQPLGRFDAKLGLRWEDTDVDLVDVTTRYASRRRDDRLYPTLNFSYDLGDREKLRASYGERVQRPDASQYDPFRFVYSPFAMQQGNPNLKLQQTQKFEFGYEYKSKDAYYFATAYYQQDSRGVAYVPISLGDNVILNTAENLTRSTSAGLELAASGRLSRTLRYNLGGDVLHNEIDAVGLGVGAPQSAWTGFGHGSLDWEFDPKDLLQLQGYASGRRLTAGGYFQPGVRLDLGLRHKFTDRLALTLTGDDLLGTSGNHSGIDTPTLRRAGWYVPHMRTAIVSLTWSFGAGPKHDPEFDYGPSH